MAGAGRAGLALESHAREHEGKAECKREEAQPPRQEYGSRGGHKASELSES